jgi:hypothetical protein
MDRKSLERERDKYPHQPIEHLEEDVWDGIESTKSGDAPRKLLFFWS